MAKSNFALCFLVLAPAAVLAYSWTNVRFGGGGYITGFTFHPSVRGLVYARTDIGGAYRRDPGSTRWTPLNDDINRDDFQLMSVLSLAIDPNNGAKLYMAAGMYLQSWGRKAALLRSNDRGDTWQRTELPFRLGGNADGRGTGERLAVDPNLGSVLFLGTNQDGLWRSADSGKTWSRVSSFWPKSTTFVLFGDRTGRRGQLTADIYVGVSDRNGAAALWRSTDAGQTWWAPPNQPGGDLISMSAALDASGVLYVTYGNALGPNGVTHGGVYAYRTKSGEWTNVAPNQDTGGYGGVAVSEWNPGVVVISMLDRWNPGDDLLRTWNRGRSWTKLSPISTHDNMRHPWVDEFKGMGHWITAVAMDPFDDNHVLYNTGYGLWETNSVFAAAVPWRFAIDGIEETAVTALASPPTGAHLLVANGDVNGARYDTVFSDVGGFFWGLVSSYSVEYAQYYADFVARTTADGHGAYLSWDNGVKWYAVPSSPVQPGHDVGKIAISASGTSMVWVPGGQTAYYSSNNGKWWTASAGYPWSGSDGYFEPVADRFVDGVFYTFDHARGLLMESGDGGRTFHVALNVVKSSGQLISVPTQRRDLWLATDAGLYHVNGVSSGPVRIGAFQSAVAIGFGARATPKSYPTLFVSGKKDGVQGLYRSVDAGGSWVRIDDNDHRFNLITSVCGDQRNFGQVYVGVNGRGVLRGAP